MNPIFTELPAKLGLYMLNELLCSREHSELYAATQSYVDRSVVIEVLRPGSDPVVVEQFRESTRNRAAAGIAHVCPVLESVQTGTFYYLIQEQPRGISLSSLVAQGDRLNYNQGFTLVEHVAELYESCRQKNLAAAPLDASSVYLDRDDFSFFSPVMAGVADDAHRDAQMLGLADLLEQVLPPELLAKSKLSVVVHWLRNGYGGVSLEWQPLLSALSSLRTQKGGVDKDGQHFGNLILRYAKRRYLKRALRSIASHGKQIALAVLAILAIGASGYWLDGAQEDENLLPAVTEQYVYCKSEGTDWRVDIAPVSVRQYGDFLEAYARMSDAEKTKLHADIPVGVEDHIPLDWKDQLARSKEKGKESENSPVLGVSYADAVVYTRYAKRRLADVDMVKTARKHASPDTGVEEWTSTWVKNIPPYDTHLIVFPAQGDTMIRETMPEQKSASRGFRTATKLKDSETSAKR